MVDENIAESKLRVYKRILDFKTLPKILIRLLQMIQSPFTTPPIEIRILILPPKLNIPIKQRNRLNKLMTLKQPPRLLKVVIGLRLPTRQQLIHLLHILINLLRVRQAEQPVDAAACLLLPSQLNRLSEVLGSLVEVGLREFEAAFEDVQVLFVLLLEVVFGDGGEGGLGLFWVAELELAFGFSEEGWEVGWVGFEGFGVEAQGFFEVFICELGLSVLKELVYPENIPEDSEHANHN